MSQNKLLLAVLVVFISTSCERLPGDINEAKREVRKSLIDPNSGEFGNIYESDNGEAVCGFVNAKNRMGGYVGSTPFVYLKKTKQVVFVPEPPSESEFEYFFQLLRSGDGDRYVELEEKCKGNLVWASRCGESLYGLDNKYCKLINDGKSMGEVYEAAKPALEIY